MACHQRKRIRKKIKVSDDEKISENRVLVTFSFSCPKVENFIFSFVWRFCPVSDGNLRKRIRKRGLRFHNEKYAKFLRWKAWKFEKRFSIRSFCPQLSDFHQFDTMTNTES